MQNGKWKVKQHTKKAFDRCKYFATKFTKNGAIMNFPTGSIGKGFSNSFNYDTQLVNVVNSTVNVFKSLSVDDQLAVLWFAYTEMGRSITPAATGAARLQLAEGLLSQIKQMSPSEQLEAMRDLAGKNNTQVTRAYSVLSANTKLAFWYELSELMVKDFVVPMPSNYQLSRDGAQVLEAIKQVDFGQQITILRKVVTDMGVSPLAD